MKRLLCWLLLAVVAPLGAAAQGGIFPYASHVETLDNGLQVILIPMDSGGLVAYWTLVRTGARDEVEPGRTGFAHFFEHMMFRGTERYPAEVYNAKVTEIGADNNAFTTDDFTAYHLGIVNDDLELVMDLESDRFRNLAYPKDMFQTEAGAVYGEYRKNRANPFFVISEAMRKEAFTAHTYDHTAMGFVEDIKIMPELYDYSLDFFSRFYRPENSILVIVGDIEVDATMEMVKTYYGPWEAGYQAPDVPVEPEQTAERRVDVAYEGRSNPMVWLAYKGEAFDPASRQQAAADLLLQLAFGETSDLHKQLVLDEQVVDLLIGATNMNRDPSLIDIIARVKDPAKIDYVIEQIDATLERYRSEPVDATRLAETQSRRKYGFLMNLDTPENVAGGLARVLAVTADLGTVDTMFETLDSVTPEDIQKAADTYFASSRRTVAVMKGAQ
ncbi:MAG: pitrilysin family protein [Acidobacteriota bacterium]